MIFFNTCYWAVHFKRELFVIAQTHPQKVNYTIYGNESPFLDTTNLPLSDKFFTDSFQNIGAQL
jgi:hypothetical protein